MSEIFRTASVCVRARPAEDRARWVVTFDNFGLGPGFERRGFGERFLAESGVSAIHVMGAGDDWYQYPEMIEAMAAVRCATADAKTVMTYGSSMGGYAALRFADAARATAALALSPQHNIDPSRPPYEDRWIQSAQNIRWLPDLAGPLTWRAQARPVVVYDQRSPDAAQAAAIASEIDLTPIGLPYAGHPISSHLAEIGLLKPLFFAVLEGRLDAHKFRAEARSRRNTPVYLTEISQALADRRPETALALARRGVECAPTNTRVLSNLGQLLLRVGRVEEGLATLARSVEVWRTDTTLTAYANALADHGRLADARRLAAEVVDLLPHLAYLRLWQAMLAYRAQDFSAALAASSEALRLDPTDPHAQALAADCRARLDGVDQPAPSVRARRLRDLFRRDMHRW
ncbi:hypothetical protein E4M02_14130 [Brevundimonas sp. S30B]|uniref:hypothetical protein n=1 Tax=unclassified Brevundimonas TaxID=2622653 RepID=UPI0010726DF5|nr:MULTISPECIES: hypothetical protein [unclassified Brevundimonas]QBX37722.1 hypothetical protein E4M01_08045 [Brevundimonas sp. MF30-B]TFW00586.1 hypothetical protein E4M02_14130 [Brevundimonas sp. S30B]